MALQPRPLLIGGEWIVDTGEVLSSVNPATGRINHEVCAAGAPHVDAAVEAARDQFDGGEWSRMDARARGIRVLATCPFVASWMRRHPEYTDLAYQSSGSAKD